MGLKKTAAVCRACQYVDTCDHKEMEHHGYLVPAAEGAAMDIAAPILEPHEYRDVWLGPNTTITIDLLEIERELERERFMQMMEWGA